MAEITEVTAPAPGPAEPAQTGIAPGEEPVATGTLFLMVILLMLIAGIWGIVYQMLLTR